MNHRFIPLATLLLLAGCANVPLDPVTPESIVGTYSLRQVDKTVTTTGGGSNSAPGNFSGAKGTLTVTKDRFAGSFSLPQEAVADTLAGTYSLTPSPTRVGVYVYSPDTYNKKGFAGLGYDGNTLIVFYKANIELPVTQYVLIFGRS